MCPAGRLVVIAAITGEPLAKKLLEHTGLATEYGARACRDPPEQQLELELDDTAQPERERPPAPCAAPHHPTTPTPSSHRRGLRALLSQDVSSPPANRLASRRATDGARPRRRASRRDDFTNRSVPQVYRAGVLGSPIGPGWQIDPMRIHMTGFSQGGALSWRFICDHADVLASVAPELDPYFPARTLDSASVAGVGSCALACGAFSRAAPGSMVEHRELPAGAVGGPTPRRERRGV